MAVERRDNAAIAAALTALAVLVGIGLWRTGPAGRGVTRAPGGGPRLELAVGRPARVMGTTCTLAALAPDAGTAARAISEAEAALREVEALMSTRLADSEISRLNGARAGEQALLSPETAEVLRAARAAAGETGGAFDVTVGPLVELWRQSAKEGRPPAEEELARARAASRWDHIELTAGGAIKRAGSARVDLGGIAKGYGIDRAVDALRGAGAVGGLVDVGGDLRCFGPSPTSIEQAGEPIASDWPVQVRDPFGEGHLATLRVRAAAVCTSGNYARFAEIAGRRYSHIIDPRTGLPAEAAPSVTVVAPTAMVADVWATALSVLGVEGMAALPPGVEALLIVGQPEEHRLVTTPGMAELLAPQ